MSATPNQDNQGGSAGEIPKGQPVTIYCTRCGKAMSVAAEHMRVTVACPHCGQQLDPWRVVSTAPPTAPPPPGSPVPGPYPGAIYGQAGPYGFQQPYSSRSKVAAGLLGIFLGGFGVHRFYLGYTGIGLLQILVTALTCPFGGLGALWGFVEGILCLTGNIPDKDGLPLRD